MKDNLNDVNALIDIADRVIARMKAEEQTHHNMIITERDNVAELITGFKRLRKRILKYGK